MDSLTERWAKQDRDHARLERDQARMERDQARRERDRVIARRDDSDTAYVAATLIVCSAIVIGCCISVASNQHATRSNGI